MRARACTTSTQSLFAQRLKRQPLSIDSVSRTSHNCLEGLRSTKTNSMSVRRQRADSDLMESASAAPRAAAAEARGGASSGTPDDLFCPPLDHGIRKKSEAGKQSRTAASTFRRVQFFYYLSIAWSLLKEI